MKHSFSLMVLITAVSGLLSACSAFPGPEPHSRINPYDGNMSVPCTQEYDFPFFSDRLFIYPGQLAVSDNGRYMAVISEPRGHLEIYDREGGQFEAIRLQGFDAEGFNDLFFSGSVLIAARGSSLVRIDCPANRYETRWSEGSGIWILQLAQDRSDGSIYAYVVDSNEERYFMDFTGFETFPNQQGITMVSSPTDPFLFSVWDFGVYNGSLYIVPDNGMFPFHTIIVWEHVTDQPQTYIHFDGTTWNITADSLPPSVTHDPQFLPFSIDIRHDSIYVFANGVGDEAIYRWPLDLSVPVPDVWPSIMSNTGEFMPVDYKTHAIVADSTDPDAVYVAEILKWTDPKTNRITRHVRSAQGAQTVIEGRLYAQNELVSARRMQYVNGRLYVLDTDRGAFYITDPGFSSFTLSGEGILNAYECRGMSSYNNNLYVSSYDYNSGSSVIYRFDQDGNSVGIPVIPAMPGATISDMLFLEDGRFLAWFDQYPQELHLFAQDGKYLNAIALGVFPAPAENLRFGRDTPGRIYLAYSHSAFANGDGSNRRHTTVVLLNEDLTSVTSPVFSTATPAFFSYVISDWSGHEDAFAMRDMTVSPSGFLWLALGSGLVARLTPLDESGTMRFQGVIGRSEGLVNNQPLPNTGASAWFDTISALDDNRLAGINGWSGYARVYGEVW